MAMAGRLQSTSSAAMPWVSALANSSALTVDACRYVVRHERTSVSLARRPVLFALLQTLAEAWPDDVSRDRLVARAFRARHADESHRARLRVEAGRVLVEGRYSPGVPWFT